MSSKLTAGAIERAAKILGCDIAAVRAVIEVEAAGDGFLADGRPKILFERHHFSHRTKGQFDARYPNISNPQRGGYLGGDAEYGRFYQALQLDASAAVESASWGIGQVMGFNWQVCGERSLMGFVFAMHDSEDAQLMLMVQYIKRSGLDDELRRHDWAAFARGYNGAAYRRNKYDEKLASAWARFAR